MKVVLDARYIREQPSGIGAYVRALVDRLPALAPDDTFELWAHPLAPRPLSSAPNVIERSLHVGANSPQTLLWPSRLAPLDGADLFHSPHNILGRGIRCPTVVTIHDLMWRFRPHLSEPNPVVRLVRAPFFASGIELALRRASRIVTISNASADDIARLVPAARRRVVVIHLAADSIFAPPPPAEERAARARASEVVGGDSPYFLLIGQNAPYKAHDLAMRAFAAASPRGALLGVVQRRMPGRGLDRLARELGIEDRMRWFSTLPIGDLVALIQHATALVQPSLDEGFGMPVLEAMASGCPVIASDIAPLREVSAGAALHVPVRDVAALAAAMRRVASDGPLRAELSAKGLERARAFSWDRCARETLAVYRDAMSSRSP